MNFSLGGVKWRFLAFAAVLLLSVTLSACSGDDKPSAPKTTATVDPKEADEAKVKDLVDRYWAVIVKAENNGDTSREQFEDVASGSVVERQLGKLANYKKMELLRVGEPTITEVEVTVTGDTADIRLCKNEDEWKAEQAGKPVGGKKFGTMAWGAEAKRTDGGWLVDEVRLPPKGAKKCA